ncbi:hypothetical protein CI109_102504 [Kwoniella shandongensis]|uniref:Uncharacterized protein n=1 Tax=Kwoniella shandongensis TaxID=1734106 RepID=A0A5M6C130_9TREE|nr:uncharacterized protein CI109_003178 [Kwoniella shandongensis]KAA5528280.1 hypothetical protein CI109_003178 [Kwoniella shandongensis]
MTATQQNIVIVGASIAGHGLANELLATLPKSHRILLIDALGFAFWPIASLRAAVAPGWEEKVTVPLTNEHVFPAGSPHQVIAPNKVVELRENSIILEHPFEGSTEVPFYKCVIATGSAQPSPMRPSGSWTEQEYIGALKKNQEDLKKAKKIVIVGGGTVGVEFAGEARALLPNTSITIVHTDTSLLSPTPLASEKTTQEASSWTSPPTNPKLSTALEKVANKQKLELIFSDRVNIPQEGSVAPTSADWDGSFGLQSGEKTLTLASGKKIKADYVFLSVGNKPNSSIVQKTDPSAITSGLVAVDPYLRVVSKNDNSPLGKNYYAIGDVSSAPGAKTAWNAGLSAKAAAVNLVNEIQGKSLVRYDPGTFSGLFVPVGPADGAGSLTIPYLGTWTVGGGMVKSAKGKALFVDKGFAGLFKGSKKVAIKV